MASWWRFVRLQIGPVLWLEEDFVEFGFCSIRFGLVVIIPTHEGRQRHENGFGASFGLEAEEGTPVVDEIEFDIAPAAVELKLAFSLGARQVLASCYDGQIGGDEVVANRLQKGKGFFEALGIIVVEKDAANPPCFIAVGQVKVVITGIFKTWVQASAFSRLRVKAPTRTPSANRDSASAVPT